MPLNRKALVVWKHTGRHGDSKASLLYDLVPRSLFWYLLLTALFLFTCDKCNLFWAGPNASLTDFNKQASNRRSVVHKNLSSSPFIRLTPVLKWGIIRKSIGTGIQTCVGYSSSLCRLERMLPARLLQASSKGCRVLRVAQCSAEATASVRLG